MPADKRKFLVPALALLALILFATPDAKAQMDLLMDLDAAMQQTEEPEPAKGAPLLKQLGDNFGATAKVRGYFFFENESDSDVPKDTKNEFGEARLLFSTRAENDNLLVHVKGWLETGTQEDTYAGVSEFFQDLDRRRKILELNELYFTLRGEAADLTFGRKVIDNGISTLFSPSNRYNAMDLNDPMDPRRLGTWQATFDARLSDVDLSFSALPFFNASKTPSSKSPWVSSDSYAGIPGYYGGDDDLFNQFLPLLQYFSNLTGVDLEALFREYFADDNPAANLNVVDIDYDLPDPGDLADWGWLGKAKTTLGDFDVFASAYHGPDVYPVIKAELADDKSSVKMTVEHPMVDQLATGFSTTKKEFEFHGEALMSVAESERDDSYIDYVVGSTWTNQSLAQKIMLDRVALTLEYAGESVMDEQSASDYFMSSKYARLGRNDLIGRGEFFINQDVSLDVLFNRMLDNDGLMQRYGATWKVTGNLTWTAALELFDGGDTSYFGRWSKCDRVVTALTYDF